jgi:hypothetical protein
MTAMFIATATMMVRQMRNPILGGPVAMWLTSDIVAITAGSLAIALPIELTLDFSATTTGQDLGGSLLVLAIVATVKSVGVANSALTRSVPRRQKITLALSIFLSYLLLCL